MESRKRNFGKRQRTQIDSWKIGFYVDQGVMDLAERETVRLALNDLRDQILSVMTNRLGAIKTGSRTIAVSIVDETE